METNLSMRLVVGHLDRLVVDCGEEQMLVRETRSEAWLIELFLPCQGFGGGRR